MQSAYRSRSQSKSKNSIPCRQPVTGPSLRLEVQQQSSPRTSLTRGQIAKSLVELCDLGLLETYRDENNIVRYKPTDGRIA